MFSQACVGKPESKGCPKAIRPNGNQEVMMGEEGMDWDSQGGKKGEEKSGREDDLGKSKPRSEKSCPSHERDEEG